MFRQHTQSIYALSFSFSFFLVSVDFQDQSDCVVIGNHQISLKNKLYSESEWLNVLANCLKYRRLECWMALYMFAWQLLIICFQFVFVSLRMKNAQFSLHLSKFWSIFLNFFFLLFWFSIKFAHQKICISSFSYSFSAEKPKMNFIAKKGSHTVIIFEQRFNLIYGNYQNVDFSRFFRFQLQNLVQFIFSWKKVFHSRWIIGSIKFDVSTKLSFQLLFRINRRFWKHFFVFIVAAMKCDVIFMSETKNQCQKATHRRSQITKIAFCGIPMKTNR